MEKIGKLVLIRHGETKWNIKGIWTGISDVDISDKGLEEAKKMGTLLKNINFDHIFISELKRTEETLEGAKETDLNLIQVPVEKAEELNERDYGDFTGKNKWEVEKEIGEEEFQKLRRGWDYPVPHGENLKMVYERTVPFFLNRILPMILEGKNILVVAHGNSIRSIVKYIENISDEDISNLEMPFQEVLIYDLDKEGHKINKEIRKI
jgi:2,3-bisphosphoglycerate-dependent phosphoglycerate mutase